MLDLMIPKVPMLGFSDLGAKTLCRPRSVLPLPLLNQAWTTEPQLEQNPRASLVIDVGNLSSQEGQRLLAVTKEFSSCLF